MKERLKWEETRGSGKIIFQVRNDWCLNWGSGEGSWEGGWWRGVLGELMM